MQTCLRYLQVFLLPVLLLLWFANSQPAQAQSCWVYSDNQPAKVPLRCVEQGNTSTLCSWNSSCHLDGDASDCCVALQTPTPQTIFSMHTDVAQLLRQCWWCYWTKSARKKPTLVCISPSVRDRLQ